MQDSDVARGNPVYTNCAVCGSGRRRTICGIKISPVSLPSYLVRCRDCGFFYANPRLPKEAEEDYYKKLYHEIQKDGYWYESRIDLFKRAVAVINRYAGTKRLIDIGCGMGYFMDLARKDGWDAKGAEISESAAGYAVSRLGLDVRKGDLKDARFDAGHFDVATLWNVLDQIYDPGNILAETNRILKNGGHIFIRVSNLSFHLKLLRIMNLLKSFIKIDIPPVAVFHLYSFDKNSIKRLLKSNGFSNIAVKTEFLDANVPGFVRIFGKKERIARNIFDAAGKIINILSLGSLILTPSLFVIARKERELKR